MDKDLIRQSEKRLSKQRNRRLWWEIVVLVALVVLTGTLRLMTGPASATTGDNTEDFSQETYDGVPTNYADLEREISLDEYVTNVTAESYTYNKDNETVSVSDLHLDFYFSDGSEVDTAALYVFNCPKDVVIPKELLNPLEGGRDEYDMAVQGGSLKGSYRLVLDSDSGSYQILARFTGTPGDWVEGYVQFDAQFGSRLIEKTEQLSIKFTDLCELTVDPQKVKIPSEDVSINYDLLVKKTGAEEQGTGRVCYTVSIYSLKGTPDVIQISDVISDGDGMLDLSSFRMESVAKYIGTYNNTVMTDWLDCYDTSQIENLSVSDLSIRRGDNGFAMELPGLSAAGAEGDESDRTHGEFYQIKYSYALCDWDQGTKTVGNKVTVSGEDAWTGKLVKDVGESSLQITRKKTCTVTKSGKLADGKATWTIHIHNTGVDLSGYKLTDTMFGSTAVLDLTVKHADGTAAADGEYRVNGTADNVTGIEFCDIDGKGNYNSYLVIYKTDVEGETASRIQNAATLVDKGGAGAGTGTATLNLLNISKSREGTYSFVDESTITQEWSTKLSVIGTTIPAGTKIFDYFNSNRNTIHYMTYEQMQELYQNVRSDWELYVSMNGGQLQKEYRDPANAKADYREFPVGDTGTRYYAFYLKAKRTYARPDSGSVKFKYSTTIDVSAAAAFGETQYYINYAYIETPKEVSVGYNFSRGGIIKTDENGATEAGEVTNSDGTLIWKVKAAPDRDSVYKTLKVTDRLPEGVALTGLFLGTPKGSITDVVPGEEKVSRTVAGSTLSCTYWMKDGVVYVEFDNGDKTLASSDVFTITYHCVVEDIDAIEEGESKTFENGASLWEGEKEIPSNVQIQTWTKELEKEPDVKVLTKSGSWDYNKQKVKYSVIINPQGRKYSDYGTVDLRDEMAIARYVWPNQTAFPLEIKAELNLEKVKLYYAKSEKDADGNVSYSKDKELDASQWGFTCGAMEYDGYKTYWDPEKGDVSSNRYTIEAKIPDGTPLILEYEYNITGNFKEWTEYADSINKKNYGSGTNEPPLTIDNQVELVGVQNTQTGEVIREEWKKSGTSGGIKTECTYEIVKVEAGNYGLFLPGAQFNIYEYDARGKDVLIDSRTTGADGKIYIKFATDTDSDGLPLFEEDTLYYIREAKAPDGYLQEKDPPSYYFYYASADSKFKLPSDDTLDLRTDGEGERINEPVNLWSLNKRAIVENTPDVTSITVRKCWQSADGKPIERNYGTIHVRLYRIGADGEAELVNYQGSDTVAIDYNAQNEWSYTFDHLTKSFQDAAGAIQPYRYYVEEVGVSSQGNTSNSTGHYLVSYSLTEDGESYTAAKDVAVTDGTVFITNRENSYALPETGGAGTHCYTYGGILLLLLAGVFSIVYRRKTTN